MRRIGLGLPLVAAVLGIAVLLPDPAAGAGRRGHDGYGTVTGHSRYANPSRTVPVRRGRFGPEIDIGNNTWLHCEGGDCQETLRRHKIDFWETKREDGGGGGRY